MDEPLLARDLMETRVIVAREEDSAADLCDMFQQAHVHGAPVVDEDDKLVGIVSVEDILIGSMTWSSDADKPGELDETGQETSTRFPRVGDIMTSPAISANEDTPIKHVCTMMWRFRIHHIPVVRDNKVMGMVSSLDICRWLANGENEADR